MRKMEKSDFNIASIVRQERKTRFLQAFKVFLGYICLNFLALAAMGLKYTLNGSIHRVLFLNWFLLPMCIFIIAYLVYSSFTVYRIYAVDYKIEGELDSEKHFVKDGDTDEWVQIEQTRFSSELTDGVDHDVLIRKRIGSKCIIAVLN